MKLDRFPYLKKVLAAEEAKAGSILEYGDWADANGKILLEELFPLLADSSDLRSDITRKLLELQENAEAAIKKINAMEESDFPDPNQRSNESKSGVLYIQQELINKTNQILEIIRGMRTS